MLSISIASAKSFIDIGEVSDSNCDLNIIMFGGDYMIRACHDKTSARLPLQPGHILPSDYMGNLNLILVGRDRFQPGTCLHFLAPKLSFFNLCGIFKQHGGYQTTFDHFHDKPVKLFFSTVDEFVFFTQLYFTKAYL